ncbi:hypothetical protein [Streptomyces sp. NPDC054863]
MADAVTATVADAVTATVADAETTEPIHRMPAARNLLPAERCLDSGYPSAELIVGVKKCFGVVLITPVLLNSSPRSHAGTGFDRTASTIDWGRRQATCPRWCRGNHRPGRRGHRREMRPPPRPAKDPLRARLQRCRAPSDPPRCLVERASFGPHPSHGIMQA